MQELLDNEIFGLLTYYQLVVIIHLIGLALGVGGAFMSEAIFTHNLSDKKISKTEYAFIELASKLVWVGLAVLIASGIILFSYKPDELLESTKFLAKMSIVAILTINGIIFHFKHIPFLKSCTGKSLPKGGKKVKQFRGVFISGAISLTSWVSALILGSLSVIDLSYLAIMGLYALAIAVAILLSQLVFKRYF